MKTLEETKAYLLSKPEAQEDFPFGPDVSVFKIKGKMFALFCGEKKDKASGIKQRPQVNLKCDPLEAIQLRDVFDDVIPGYHMNKKHWNTIYLSQQDKPSDVPMGELERQIDNSYGLVVKGMTKAMRRSLEVSYSNKELYGEDQ